MGLRAIEVRDTFTMLALLAPGGGDLDANHHICCRLLSGKLTYGIIHVEMDSVDSC